MATARELVSLNTIFDEGNDGSNVKIAIKILKAISPTEFLVADSTGSCKLKIDNLKPIYMGSLKENNFVRILNFKIKKIERNIIVDCKSKVFMNGRFDINLKKSALEQPKTDAKILQKPIPSEDFQTKSRQQAPVPLKDVFEMKYWLKRFKITVKILKEISENEFLVADSTSSRKIKIDNLKPIYMANLIENNFVKILNATVSVASMLVIVDYKSSVFNIPRFENVKDPANARPKDEYQNTVQYKIPKRAFEEFMKRANEKKFQTLGFLVGYKVDDVITVTDIIFGKQNATKYKVNDDGKQKYHLCFF